MINENIEYQFYVNMDLTLIAKVNARNIEEAVGLIKSMSTSELLRHEPIDISVVDFESVG
jgi:hypothetical protein